MKKKKKKKERKGKIERNLFIFILEFDEAVFCFSLGWFCCKTLSKSIIISSAFTDTSLIKHVEVKQKHVVSYQEVYT